MKRLNSVCFSSYADNEVKLDKKSDQYMIVKAKTYNLIVDLINQGNTIFYFTISSELDVLFGQILVEIKKNYINKLISIFCVIKTNEKNKLEDSLIKENSLIIKYVNKVINIDSDETGVNKYMIDNSRTLIVWYKEDNQVTTYADEKGVRIINI